MSGVCLTFTFVKYFSLFRALWIILLVLGTLKIAIQGITNDHIADENMCNITRLLLVVWPSIRD